MAAESTGADRLELCGPGDGGLTPTIEVLISVLQNLKIPINEPINKIYCQAPSIGINSFSWILIQA